MKILSSTTPHHTHNWATCYYIAQLNHTLVQAMLGCPCYSLMSTTTDVVEAHAMALICYWAIKWQGANYTLWDISTLRSLSVTKLNHLYSLAWFSVLAALGVVCNSYCVQLSMFKPLLHEALIRIRSGSNPDRIWISCVHTDRLIRINPDLGRNHLLVII